jgi:hypothetical protein
VQKTKRQLQHAHHPLKNRWRFSASNYPLHRWHPHTYDALKNLQLALNANAASVWSNLGNGLLGLLALTVSPEVHDALAGEPFVVSINPGPAATFPTLSPAPKSPTHAKITTS